jgi:hypothetical protein
MMMTRLTSPLYPATLGGFLLLTLAAGCGSSVDHASAVQVMNLALSGTVAADGQVVSVNLDPAGGQITAALTNPAGSGTATVNGTLAHNGSVTTTTLDIELKDWSDLLHHVTLDGSLHEAGSFSSQLPLLGDVKLTGALAASGDISATVDFDLQASYSLTSLKVTGDVGGQSMGSGINLSL